MAVGDVRTAEHAHQSASLRDVRRLQRRVGSNPATSNGGQAGFTQLTPALQDLMTQAKLAPEFLNYRLDGVQIDFTTADGKPTLLGNSVIEGENVGMKTGEASCITCHSVSSIKTDGTDRFDTLSICPVPLSVPSISHPLIGLPVISSGRWDLPAPTRPRRASRPVTRT